jgi:hypothetical protein
MQYFQRYYNIWTFSVTHPEENQSVEHVAMKVDLLIPTTANN